MKYYAVRIGRQVGIFTTWKEAESMVKGFSGAQYKSFAKKEEAQSYIEGNNNHLNINIDVSDDYIFYTDGSAKDGKGGWGYVQIDPKSNSIVEQCGHVDSRLSVNGYVTNDISELVAVQHSLLSISMLSNLRVKIYSDSIYVVNTFNRWIHEWKRNGWRRSGNNEIKNLPLIQNIDQLRDKHQVYFMHVKAHSNNTFNEMADRLAEKGRIE